MDDLKRLAHLIRQRNEIEVEITRIIGRPAQIGHIGEYLAAKLFSIELASSATEKGHDGRFKEGPLEGRTVNIKWYAKHEGLLDIEPRFVPDFYLVLTGPHGLSGSSKGTSRPWLTTSVFLFDALQLVDALAKAGIKVGLRLVLGSISGMRPSCGRTHETSCSYRRKSSRVSSHYSADGKQPAQASLD
jgi:hypothetical protein